MGLVTDNLKVPAPVELRRATLGRKQHTNPREDQDQQEMGSAQ